MDQAFVIAVLGVALVFFMWGRWRYDVVAIGALLALTVAGIVDPAEAFLGFGHPAVVTVAAVLVISRGLERAGVVELVSRGMGLVGESLVLQVSALTVLVAVFSAFMNNVGALALFLPVAIRMAREHERPASFLLMPLAFGSLLGGLTTLVGTPPNIIIATVRAQEVGRPFGMFDFAPVGVGVALAGILLICLVGWRWLPRRKGEESRDELFEVDDYLTEVRVPEESRWVGRSLAGLGEALAGRIVVLGIARGDREITVPSGQQPFRAEDVLLVEAEPEDLRELVDREGLEPVGSQEMKDRLLASGDEAQVVEAVVQPDSRLAGSTARELELRAGHGVNLLGVARQGRRVAGRVADTVFQPGDVLLLQGAPDAVQQTLSSLGGLPLAERGLQIGVRRRVAVAAGIFAGGIALTVFGVLPVQVALTGAALVMVAVGLLPLGGAYEAVDWPVIVLLGAMLPVGEALETTGGAEAMAGLLLEAGSRLPAEASVAAVLVAAMLLSNVINNAAAAVVMAPIGLAVARGLEVSPDPFLMAVAVGASCAFLTPIGHQSNTLVMGPGGYRFSDYLYLGLPMTLLVLAASVPLILVVWPL